MSHKFFRLFFGLILALAISFTGLSQALASAPANTNSKPGKPTTTPTSTPVNTPTTTPVNTPTNGPTNDNFSTATNIGSLPFSDSVDITNATIESGEPQFCNFAPQTVWYSFTPAATAAVKVDMQGSSFSDNVFSIYQAFGSGFGGLSVISCASFGNSVTFNAQAGTTYYIQAGKINGGAGTLSLNLQVVPPPANDNFSNATLISALPFNDSIDTTSASRESGEPNPSCGNSSATIWYTFTPTVSGSISASGNGSFSPIFAAYTGSSLANLIEVGCHSFGLLTFHVNAGTTYYIQLGSIFGNGGTFQFTLNVTPPPVAGICFGPSDPSVFDSVQFNDCSFDPGNVGFQSFTWNFGDGTTLVTSTNCCVNHQYAADGDYTVQHGVTTLDGRTASTSQVVHVRTHDVAITKFSVPQTARVNQTKTINVNVQNKRYSENVQVTLFMGLPGGGQQVIGTLTLFVPASATQPTIFKFSYTFTTSDATVGKVTFTAVATLVNSRDAFPSDNTAIATTLVSGSSYP